MKFLVLGQSPLPIEEGNQHNAPGVRAWHFGLALSAAGHEVRLVAISQGSISQSIPEKVGSNLFFQKVGEAEISGGGWLARLENEFKPDAVVGASVWPSYLAALFSSPGLPLWGDLFGSPLAEGQAKAALYEDDGLIEPFARYERTVLERADAVSGVSDFQKNSLIGALAARGRLNRATFGQPLAFSIPAAVDEQVLAPDRTVLRGTVVPQHAFVVLWSGGYNTWTDIETLFEGLEETMRRNPRLHFVSTGGGLPPHDSLTYPRFQELINCSAYRDRYHLLGWLPLEGLHNYYLESDLGIILDKWSYEGVLGSRTRLLDWLKYGLCSAVTLTSELTFQLEEAGLAFSFPHGQPNALADLLFELSENPLRLQEARRNASGYVLYNFHYSRVCDSLISWAVNPRRAADAGVQKPEFFSGGTDLQIEKRLAFYQSQIEGKNAQIASLEKWSREMEAQLKKPSRRWSFFSPAIRKLIAKPEPEEEKSSSKFGNEEKRGKV